MDSSSYNKAASAGGGAGEVRRINVVYFLSRGGRTDHPHLFRVHHRSSSSRAGGVRLRDVKKWLSEIRGKDMPDSFSWSYKRKYKAGYVWQDLKDDDLITPVSDNEYVLKGCDVRGTPPRSRCVVQEPQTASSLLLDERTREEKTRRCSDQLTADRPTVAVEEVVLTPDDSSDESSPKPLDADDQDSLAGSGDSSSERRSSTVLFKIQLPQHRGQSQRRQEPASTVKEREQLPQGAAADVRCRAVVAGNNKARRSMRVARALHSILTCGTADADDAALRPVVVARRSAVEADDWTLPTPTPTPTCPGMEGCGLGVGRKVRLRRGGKEQQGKRRGDGGGKRRYGRDAHKPVALPRCSQCGKEFKPQELHLHMQSCRGFKERMRSNNGSSRVSGDGGSRSYSCTARSAEYRSKHGRFSQDESSATAVFLLTGS